MLDVLGVLCDGVDDGVDLAGVLASDGPSWIGSST